MSGRNQYDISESDLADLRQHLRSITPEDRSQENSRRIASEFAAQERETQKANELEAHAKDFFRQMGDPDWAPIDPHFSMPHFQYLGTPLWRKIRRRVIKRDQALCVLCAAKATEVHHLSYKYEVILGQCDEDLVSLCSSCHKKIEFTSEGQHRSVAEKLSFYQELKDAK